MADCCIAGQRNVYFKAAAWEEPRSAISPFGDTVDRFATVSATGGLCNGDPGATLRLKCGVIGQRRWNKSYDKRKYEEKMQRILKTSGSQSTYEIMKEAADTRRAMNGGTIYNQRSVEKRKLFPRYVDNPMQETHKVIQKPNGELVSVYSQRRSHMKRSLRSSLSASSTGWNTMSSSMSSNQLNDSSRATRPIAWS
jgi:hypothetical protein